MISPDTTNDLRAERRFDLLAATLIGVIAVLAAVLAVVQLDTGQKSARAQQQGAALAADLSARLQTLGITTDQLLTLRQASLSLQIQGTAHQLSGTIYGDKAAVEIGTQENAAAARLAAALDATAATSGGDPLDPYTSGMLKVSNADLYRELAEQNRQVDLADEYGTRNARAILGLSFLALAGVLTGLGAVLREGRAGWFTLASAVAMAGAAAAMGVWAII